MTENRAQRDGDAWAKPVAHLEVTGVEPGSSGINVAGQVAGNSTSAGGLDSHAFRTAPDGLMLPLLPADAVMV